MIIPNEHVVTSTVFNHSTGDRQAPPAAAVWLPGADVQAARSALAPLEATGIELEEITPRGSGSSFTAQVARTALGPGGEEAALRERARTSCCSRRSPRAPW